MRSTLLILALFAMMARAFVVTPAVRPVATARSPAVEMGVAKDGPFTPAVKFARLVLGDKNLSKLRGKGIAYHSQYINEFCADCTSLPF